jgi:hypothetical protein
MTQPQPMDSRQPQDRRSTERYLNERYLHERHLKLAPTARPNPRRTAAVAFFESLEQLNQTFTPAAELPTDDLDPQA